jgi:hypothetical protein
VTNIFQRESLRGFTKVLAFWPEICPLCNYCTLIVIINGIVNFFILKFKPDCGVKVTILEVNELVDET